MLYGPELKYVIRTYFDTRWRSAQVPDAQCAWFAANEQGSTIGKQFARANVTVTLKTFQLGNWCGFDRGHTRSTVGRSHVPDFDATFPAGVDVPGRVAHCDCAHHFSVLKGEDGSGVSRDSGPQQGVRRKLNWLRRLTLCTHVKRARSAKKLKKNVSA